MKEMAIGTLLTLVLVMGYNQLQDNDITFGKQSDVNTIVERFEPIVKVAFDNAEKKHLDEVKPDPTPEPDDGTHPDPQKCICKGTGWIVQGDGHKTECFYHGPNADQGPGHKIYQDWMKLKQDYSISRSHAATLAELGAKQTNPNCDYYDCHCKDCDCTAEQNCRRQTNDEPNSIKRADRPKNTDKLAHYQLLIFTDDWSSPCQDYKVFLKKFIGTDIKVGTTPDSDIRLLDINEFKSFYDKHRGEYTDIPLTLEVKNNRIVSKTEGSMTATQLLDKYDLEK